ncbi:MAG: cobalamin biosynthesis protein [Rhizobiaceae bacterium]
MVVEEAVIVAGIGSRKGVGAAEVRRALDAALAAHGLEPSAVAALATTPFKADEAGIFEAGKAMGIPVRIVEPAAVEIRPDRQSTLTRSALSLSLAGTPSVSESAALAAAGPGARLLGPRIVMGRVTCALAESRP